MRWQNCGGRRLSDVTENEAQKWGIHAFVGKSPHMQEVIKKVRLLQKSGQTNVLLLGESGTGKELVARVVCPVGQANGRQVDVRFVSATHTNIQERIASGKFRADLYHRLSAYELTLPPLRERTEDIPPLVQYFVALLSKEMSIAQPAFDKPFLDALKHHPFRGNVRELRNILERALIDADGKDLSAEHLRLSSVLAADRSSSEAPADVRIMPQTLLFNLKKAETQLVQRAMDHTHGNVAEASRLLGISRARIYRILG